jgi:putative transposase
VAPRVSPTVAIRAEIHELFASDGELLSVLEQVARLSVRLTFQSVVEEIVCEELGRDRYQRRREDSPEGYRNGWQQPRTLKTAAGPVSLQRPKLRHAHAALCDQLFGVNVSRTNALETLVISCWVRGLSDRDVEAMLIEVFGQDATISRTTASRICQRLRAEFDAGAGATCRRPRSTTSTWMAASSSCTPRPRRSRCWPPGASTLTDTRCSSALGRGRPSRPTPGEGSSRT